jgi:hypothetical protein
LLVHASARGDDISAAEIGQRYGVRPPTFMPEGGIIGIADLVDCVRYHPSEWYQHGHYALVLANPRPLPFVRWRGVQSLQNVPQHLLDQLKL